MNRNTAIGLLRELGRCWVNNAHRYARRIPDNLLSETLSHYYQACEVLRLHPLSGDLERVAVAKMQLMDIDDIEGKRELSKLLHGFIG